MDIKIEDFKNYDYRNKEFIQQFREFDCSLEADIRGMYIENKVVINSEDSTDFSGCVLFKCYVGCDVKNAIVIDPVSKADDVPYNLENLDLSNAKLFNVSLRGANLKNATLWDADLESADLRDANLENARLKDANLELADFRGANLKGADLHGTKLLGADFSDTNIKEAKYGDVCRECFDTHSTIEQAMVDDFCTMVPLCGECSMWCMDCNQLTMLDENGHCPLCGTDEF